MQILSKFINWCNKKQQEKEEEHAARALLQVRLYV
jgi:hypothetical protein